MPTSREPGRSSASRLFAVLDAFDRRGPVLTLSEIVEATGLPQATAFRTIRELLAHGALERSEGGGLQVGLRLWELGSLAPRQRDLRNAARPVMVSLHEATGETVQLVVLDEHRAVCVEKVAGSRSATNVTEVAGRLPLHATSVGKTILAFCPEESERVSAAVLPRFTPDTIVDAVRLAAELERTRERYYSLCHEELTPGTASVAAPLFDAEGKFVGALGVLTSSAPALPRLAPAVRTAALTISRRLGNTSRDWPQGGR